MGYRVTDQPLNLSELLAETEDSGSGALVVFVGTVRDHNGGKPVEAVTYEAYIPLAEKVLEELEREVLKRFDVRACRIQHRVGTLRLGEPSVAIVVRAAHRAEAFEGAHYAIDELKRTVPIWKEERYTSGEGRFLEGIPLQYGCNSGDVSASESEGAAMEREEILKVLSEHGEILRERFGVRSLALFGSIVRGEARPDSDVDLLVEFERPVGLFEFVRLQLYLEELLGRRVDLVTPDAVRPAMREHIFKEAVRAG
jgi:molybdopterin synthase catalytic subunit